MLKKILRAYTFPEGPKGYTIQSGNLNTSQQLKVRTHGVLKTGVSLNRMRYHGRQDHCALTAEQIKSVDVIGEKAEQEEGQASYEPHLGCSNPPRLGGLPIHLTIRAGAEPAVILQRIRDTAGQRDMAGHGPAVHAIRRNLSPKEKQVRSVDSNVLAD